MTIIASVCVCVSECALSALALNFVCMYIVQYMCSVHAIEREVVQTAAVDLEALCLVVDCIALYFTLPLECFFKEFSTNFDLVENVLVCLLDHLMESCFVHAHTWTKLTKLMEFTTSIPNTIPRPPFLLPISVLAVNSNHFVPYYVILVYIGT